ncbi:unnamed protein product [Heligmosomoides polygyrus]|uniref:Transposase n=1 Tax=Heligmosomoides polygyrus TaxID=6339 RepID=A0A183FT29_HELPZ|nr:unnamed protein product [Heligmosomoides polygyrus]
MAAPIKPRMSSENCLMRIQQRYFQLKAYLADAAFFPTQNVAVPWQVSFAHLVRYRRGTELLPDHFECGPCGPTLSAVHRYRPHDGSVNLRVQVLWDLPIAEHASQRTPLGLSCTHALVTNAKIVPYETVAPLHRPLIFTLKIAPPRLKQVERCGAARIK